MKIFKKILAGILVILIACILSSIFSYVYCGNWLTGVYFIILLSATILTVLTIICLIGLMVFLLDYIFK
jgi:hypothetical protein